jgi:hypothetical protein
VQADNGRLDPFEMGGDLEGEGEPEIGGPVADAGTLVLRDAEQLRQHPDRERIGDRGDGVA